MVTAVVTHRRLHFGQSRSSSDGEGSLRISLRSQGYTLDEVCCQLDGLGPKKQEVVSIVVKGGSLRLPLTSKADEALSRREASVEACKSELNPVLLIAGEDSVALLWEVALLWPEWDAADPDSADKEALFPCCKGAVWYVSFQKAGQSVLKTRTVTRKIRRTSCRKTQVRITVL